MNEQDFNAKWGHIENADQKAIYDLYTDAPDPEYRNLNGEFAHIEEFLFDPPDRVDLMNWEDPEDSETLIISCAHVAEYFQHLGFDRNEFTPDGQFIVY